MMTINEKALSIFFEIEKLHGRRPADVALLYQAAISALYATADVSDDPAEWIRQARRAARLEP
jgi:hypothetical protein